MKIFILYPNQLFKNISNFVDKKVILVEEPLFFTQYDFHIQKLILHRASMKFYENYLKQKNILVEYFEDESYLELYKDEEIFVYELFDNYLEKKVYKNFSNITTIKNPNFINPNDKNKFLHKFYINRRKELNIFMQNGKPLFDKYSFDEDNRKKLPKDIKESFLFHSNISSSLNIGLIDLNELIEKIVNSKAPYNAKEGFIRQIIGWREFMLRVYEDNGTVLRNSNFFEFKNPIPKKIIKGKSGIQILDDTIKKLELTAYNHHIERLMILGNIFLLLEINPNEVYEFFMKNYIDAYDWVMVGNVYGMSGISDGGSITTKPYISSSNYLLKMSDYSKNESWCEILDALYWRFLYKYSFKFDKNPRMKMQIALLNKMPKEKLENHLLVAKKFIDDIFITN